MNIAHILTEIINTPLFVTQSKLSVIMSLLDRKSGFQLGFDPKMFEAGPDMRSASIPVKRDPNEGGLNIAVIDMIGSLVSRNAGFSDGSGMRSYRGIQHDIQRALGDDDIGGIILDIDSFGGSAAGVDRFARFIREADQIKPIYAAIDLSCFSAALYSAAACRKIILTDRTSAGVGSIGCIALFRSQVKKNKKDGYEYEAFTFGEQKNDYSPHLPLKNRARKAIQESVNAYGRQFAEAVAEFRGLKLGAVLDTQAGLFYGQDAIDVGLADEVATFNEAVAMMAAEIEEQRKTTFTGGSAMTTKERFAALLAGDGGPEALAGLGYIKAEVAEKAVKATALEEGRKLGLKQALDVAQIGDLGGVDAGVVAKMLGEDMDADKARETVQAIRAEKSAKTQVTSTITTDTGNGKHLLVAACEAKNQ